MRIPSLRRVASWVRQSYLGPGVLILLYHRVAEVGVDPWGLCVTPRHFDEQLEVIRRRGPVLTLMEAVEALRTGSLPHRAAVVTFDDGYADNLHAALPLLERHETPATFFLTTGTLGSTREFWWDELERVLLGTARLPGTLQLNLGGQTLSWDLTGGTAPVETPRSWRAWEDPPSVRHALYYELWQRLIKLPDEQQQAALTTLRAWSGSTAEARSGYRTMTAAEVIELAGSPLAEIGAHTVTHPALPTLPPGQQRVEIEESKIHLEHLLGQPITSFSYPYGRYGPDARAHTLASGFACGCTTVPRPTHRNAHPFLLPRFQVFDAGGEAFRRQMNAWDGIIS